MNMIVCDKHCIYQKDGYCALEGPASLTNSESDCAYFNPEESGVKNLESLGNVTNPIKL